MKHQFFNAFWHGRELSPMHWACVKSFADRGHRLRVFAYRPVTLPPGVESADAAQVMPESELFEFRGSFSAFSNIFRYTLLLEEGGWWTDTDVFCQSDDIPECTHAWAAEDDATINGALLRFPAGDATLRTILESARAIGRDVKAWGELGPRLLTQHLAGRVFGDHYGTTQAFYPLHWLEAHLFWLPGGSGPIREWCADSPFVHLWAAMFPQMGIDIDQPAPEGSYLRWLLRQSGRPDADQPADPARHAASLDSIRAYFAHPWVHKKWQQLFGDRSPLPA